MFSLAPSTGAGCSRPSGPINSPWTKPGRQQPCASAPVCRVSKSAAYQATGQPGHTSSNGSSTAGNLQGAAAHGHPQQVVASEVLERAAAAPRPAGPPPEPNTASSSGSNGYSNSSSPKRRQHRSSSDNAEQACGDAAAVAAGSEPVASAAAAAEAMARDLASADLQPWPAYSAPAGNGNSSSGAGAVFEQPLAAGGNRLSDADWALMQRIRQQCGSCDELEVLYRDTCQHFTVQHHAAALYQLAALWQQLLQQAAPQAPGLFAHASKLHKERVQMQQLGASLLRGLSAQMLDTQLRDLADAWHAVDALGLLQRPGAAAAVAETQSSNGSETEAAGGRLVSAAFVTASLQHSGRLLRQQEVQLRHLSRLLTTFAHLRLQPSGDWWAAALDAAAGGMEKVLQQPLEAPTPSTPSSSTASHQQQPQHSPQHEQEQAEQQVHQEPRAQGASSAASSAVHANAQAVALIGWAAAKLKAPASPAWWQLFHAASAHLMPVMWARHLCNCLNALAYAGHAPDAAWMEGFYAACSQNWEWLKPQGFANILWALAVLQLQPPREWLASLDAASATKLQFCSLQHLGISMWALAKLHQQRGSHGSLQAAAEGRSSNDAQPNMQQPQQPQLQVPSPAWQEQAWVHINRQDISSQDPQGLACFLWGVVRLQQQVQVPQARWPALEEMCYEGMAQMGPQALSVTVWALGSLRGAAVHRRLARLARNRYLREPELLQHMTPDALCMLLSGLAHMSAYHPESFKGKLVEAVAARIPTAQQLQLSKKQRRKQQQLLQNATAAQLLQQEAWQAAGQGAAGGLSTPGSNRGRSVSQGNTQVLQAESLPYVLLNLRQLQVAAPPTFLSSVESALEQRLQSLPLQQLCLGLFALAASKHTADTPFLVAALWRIDAEVQQCSWVDVSQVLFCLAMMRSWGGTLQLTLQQPEQQAQMHRLVAHAQEALPQMDHRALAMLLWSLSHLQLQPSERFLQAVMASTRQHMPSMSLLSIVTILSAFKSLRYLPPLPWMVEVCSAARAKVSTDSTAKVWQQRACVRRFEETVAWYNQTVQQQTGVSLSSVDGSMDGEEVEEVEWQEEVARSRRLRLGMAAKTSSEAMLAAAMGVAAAVAQQWHP